MNRDRIAGKWHELKGKVREKWGKLTHDEVEMINGRQEKLSGLLQKKYGWAKEQADREIEHWCDTCERGFFKEHEKSNLDVNEPAWSQEGYEEKMVEEDWEEKPKNKPMEKPRHEKVSPEEKMRQGQKGWGEAGSHREKPRQEEQREKKRKAG